jgi:hypothetical protein
VDVLSHLLPAIFETLFVIFPDVSNNVSNTREYHQLLRELIVDMDRAIGSDLQQA